MSARVVVDASVALKWFFDDETDLILAREVLARRDAGALEIVVPFLWPSEVLNGIWSAGRRKRVSPDRAREIADDFLRLLALGLATIDPALPDASIFRLAVALDRTVYDTAYVVLAETRGIDFVTADERLVNSVHPTKPFVKHLRDYKPPPLPPTS